ncbi:UNVERIFIED_CONTAM: hypothetical protein FKN15_054027 [Acipenser sinensis]
MSLKIPCKLHREQPNQAVCQLHTSAELVVATDVRHHQSDQRVLASTHFEPTSARMAFPCFDEPAFKANYSVVIRRGDKHIALSNMPKVKTVELGGGIFEDHFDVSVRMSTYLVAFIVCDFKSVSQITSTGIEVSIYAVPDKWDQTHYALEAAVKLLEFYEQYFNIYYPLPKQESHLLYLLDLVAIPDFQSGAMENWGLTTYRETSLLFDAETSSASDKLWVTMVIGHELAHQWFGNLVTMQWWNDIWLNEGFARYMEFVSVDATYPELQVGDYLLDTCFAAIGRDSMNSSRSISSAAENPTQIKEMFDTVSYDKTCSEEDFTSGEFCYSSSQASKNAYQYAGEHLDLKAMMNTWTLQKGIPLIIVERRGSTVTLRQERFLKAVLHSDPVWSSLQQGYLWHVPLTYITSNSKNIGRHLLETQSEDIFQSGIVRYLKKFSYRNAKNEDLWNSIANTCSEEDFTSGEFCYSSSQASKNAYQYAGEHLDLKAMMNTWTLQKGIPLIIVERRGSTVTLRQERFLKAVLHSDPVWSSLQQGYLWHVPLTYITSNSKNIGRHLLETQSDTIKLEGEVSWVKFNADMNGYYVVHYEGDGWDSLIHLLDRNHTALSHKDRTNLIHNAFQLVSAGRLTLDRALDLSRYLRHEAHNIPLLQGLGYLEAFYRMIEKRNITDNYILQYFKAVIDKQTWSDEGSVSDRRLRSEVLGLACDLGYPPCVKKAHQLFNDWVESNSSLRLLELGMEGDVIRTQDLSTVIYSVSRNPIGHFLAWDFVKKHWSELVEKFHLGSFCIRNIIIGTTAQFSSREELEEVKMFFESIREQSSQLRVTQVAIENLEKNIKWLERNLETLRDWLLKNLQ